jgi:murein DD-endopeptidase MepM/ murein hydrolase activator NlpD
MRRWDHHRTRSKVALLLLINLVTLLGGRYTALITLVKLELFGEAIAFAKTPKKKPSKSHLGPPQSEQPSAQPAKRRATKLARQASDGRLLTHVVGRGETLSEVAAAYGVGLAALQAVNGLADADRLRGGQTLRIPRPAAERWAQADDHPLGVQRHLERHVHPPGKGRRGFLWPVEGVLTSPFGERDHVMGGGGSQFHAGIDLAVPIGTPVRAAQAGIVVFAGYNGAYGKVVKLDHLNGYATLYAHNSRLLVHVGQTVKAGQVLGLSGSTGRSTGPHLHFEVHEDGSPVDPLRYLP